MYLRHPRVLFTTGPLECQVDCLGLILFTDAGLPLAAQALTRGALLLLLLFSKVALTSRHLTVEGFCLVLGEKEDGEDVCRQQ